MATTAEKVAKGYALLSSRTGDGTVPSDWKSKIDLSTLDMDNYKRCILGQIFGEYQTGLDRLGLAFGSDYGFASDSPFEEGEWIKLLTDPSLVGEIYRNNSGDLIKVKAEVSVDVAGMTVQMYVVAYGSIVSGEADIRDAMTNIGIESHSYIEANYPKEFVPFPEFPAGSFLTDDKGRFYFAEGPYRVWELKDTGALWSSYGWLEGRGLKILNTGAGDPFRTVVDGVKKA